MAWQFGTEGVPGVQMGACLPYTVHAIEPWLNQFSGIDSPSSASSTLLWFKPCLRSNILVASRSEEARTFWWLQGQRRGRGQDATRSPLLASLYTPACTSSPLQWTARTCPTHFESGTRIAECHRTRFDLYLFQILICKMMQ